MGKKKRGSSECGEGVVRVGGEGEWSVSVRTYFFSNSSNMFASFLSGGRLGMEGLA